MEFKDQNKVIKEEVDAIIKDIKMLYKASGKRTTGKFESLLKATYTDSKAIIEGSPFLAGRVAGKMPPVQSILEWVKAKGLQPIKEGQTQTSLAWAIAITISKKGIKKENHLEIYSKVITPKRIDEVIKKVSQFNVNLFVSEMEASLIILEKNI